MGLKKWPNCEGKDSRKGKNQTRKGKHLFCKGVGSHEDKLWNVWELHAALFLALYQQINVNQESMDICKPSILNGQKWDIMGKASTTLRWLKPSDMSSQGTGMFPSVMKVWEAFEASAWIRGDHWRFREWNGCWIGWIPMYPWWLPDYQLGSTPEKIVKNKHQ